MAALGVIWVHSAINLEVAFSDTPGFPGRFGRMYFVVAALYFAFVSQLRDPHKPFSTIVRTRTLRIFFPFVGWTLIYMGMKAAESELLGCAWTLPAWWLFPLTGAAYHLWFLPFIFVVGLALYPVGRLVALRSQTWLRQEGASASVQRAARARMDVLGAAAVALGLLVALLPFPSWWFGATEDLVFLWWTSVPSVCWAVGLLCLRASERLQFVRTSDVRGAAWTVFATSLVAGTFWPEIQVLAANAAGLGLVLVALSSGGAWLTRRLAPWGRHSYGVYLTHVIFVGLCRTTLGELGVSDSTPLFALTTTILTFVGALALTLALSRSRLTAWMV